MKKNGKISKIPKKIKNFHNFEKIFKNLKKKLKKLTKNELIFPKIILKTKDSINFLKKPFKINQFISKF